jgi:hypothetical protein
MNKFIDFKNFLKKSNILLFDGEYRIAHYNYLQIVNSLEQKGGSNNSSDFLANKIKKHGDNFFRIFIDSLVKNNTQRIEYILEKINN